MEFPWPSHGVVRVRGSRQAQGHLFKIAMTQRHEITNIKHSEDSGSGKSIKWLSIKWVGEEEDEYKMGKEWKEVNTKWLGGPATGASLGLAHRALRYTKELRRFDLTEEYWV